AYSCDVLRATVQSAAVSRGRARRCAAVEYSIASPADEPPRATDCSRARVDASGATVRRPAHRPMRHVTPAVSRADGRAERPNRVALHIWRREPNRQRAVHNETRLAPMYTWASSVGIGRKSHHSCRERSEALHIVRMTLRAVA